VAACMASFTTAFSNRTLLRKFTSSTNVVEGIDRYLPL
jgi:hypothetical protein